MKSISSTLRSLTGRIARHKKAAIALSLSVTVVLAVAGLVLLFAADKSHNASEPRPPCPWAKPGTDEIDWDRVNALTRYNFALNSQDGSANKPVKGQLQVKLDPSALASLPESLTVYKYVPLVQSEEQFKEIAARFGLKGEREPGKIRISDGNRGISYSPEMDEITYRDRKADAWQRKTPKVPSEEECKKIAMKIAKDKELLPPGARVIATNVSNGQSDEWEDNQYYVTRRTIVIGVDNPIDGYIVRGPGMQLRMELCDNGELAYFSDNLKRIESYGTFKRKPIEQALAEAQAGTDTMNLEYDVENPTITEIDILYYSDSSERANGLLMPVYALMGSDCMIYVPAVVQ